MDERDKITGTRADLYAAAKGGGQVPDHVMAWLDGRALLEVTQTAEDVWTYYAEPFPEPVDEQADAQAGAEAVALVQSVLDSVATDLLPGLVEVIAQRDEARAMAMTMEEQNAALAASLTEVLPLVPPQSWASGTRAVDAAQALLSSLEP